MVLATMFVSLPFVVREVVPVLREIGTDQEQAAATLGAGPFATFRRVTLPAIRWAVAYGVVLTTARAIGEFGAVSVVSGRIAGRTRDADAARAGRATRTFDVTGAYAASVVLAMIAIATLVLMTIVQAQGGARVISVRNVTKRFGEFVALDDVSVDVASGALTRAARAERLRQVDAAARDRRARAAGHRRRVHLRQARRRGCGRRSAASASSSSTTRRSST